MLEVECKSSTDRNRKRVFVGDTVIVDGGKQGTVERIVKVGKASFICVDGIKWPQTFIERVKKIPSLNDNEQFNGVKCFELWELLVWEKIQRFGDIDETMRQAIIVDLNTYWTVEASAKYLDAQIQDMKEQLAEQKQTV